MSGVVPAGRSTLGEEQPQRVSDRYGHFSTDGREYCITNPRTPRPWVNIVANPRMGFAISQTGSGFTWIDNSQLAVITRWQQDLAHDASGKFLYVRDAESGELWSLAPAPTWPLYDHYACHHGLGYTTFRTQFSGIRAEWTLFCHPREAIEFWRVELQNLTDRPRRLDLCAYLEWCCGVAPSPRREFHKLFIETEFDPSRRAVFARNHMWEVPSKDHGHWNTTFPFISALASTEPIRSAQGDKASFFGRYCDMASPAALEEDVWQPRFGRHEDPIAAMRSRVELPPAQSCVLGYALIAGTSRGSVEQCLQERLSRVEIDRALSNVCSTWGGFFTDHRVETPEQTLDYLVNDWLRYQAISGRIWGRCGYYQQSGAFGFRDQLQDSQVWLTIDPKRCREQINLHAAHQLADGSAYHWWHPLSEQGLVTRMTDDLLWLAFVTASYIKETGDLSILDDATPFVDEDEPQSLSVHIARAFARVFQRVSPRGLPHIGAGDWNDGLNAVGLQERGESIWLGQFLVGLLRDWAEVYRRTGQGELAGEFERRRRALITALNEHGWDGKWYLRATLDDGSPLGSAANRVAKIFLNAQTWAVLNDVAPVNRATQCMASVREHLLSEAGPLLLAPAFDKPDPTIGYITRYAPGLRENGGVYTHAATWAIAAACRMRDHEMVGRLLTAINPAIKDPERYWAEPYVMPGNVDGPDSPYYGRGGWTWYTGSAAWLHRVVTEWVLGVRPEWDGLRIEPCLPPVWPGARMVRPYRGGMYHIQIERSPKLPQGVHADVMLDGRRLAENLVPPPAMADEHHDVLVRCR